VLVYFYHNNAYKFEHIKKIMAKNKKSVDMDTLDFRQILEEAVACSRLGRTIASYGATLTGREKQNANHIYLLLKSGRPLPERTSATASISTEKKSKKFGYKEALDWFKENYPKEAEPLVAKLKEKYDDSEKAVIYGIQGRRDLPDNYYINVLVDILQIPEHESGVIFYGTIKPQFERMKEEEGLVRLVMK